MGNLAKTNLKKNNVKKQPSTPSLAVDHPAEALMPGEVALHESEVKFRRLFEAAQVGIVLIDAESGQVTDVNPFLEKTIRSIKKFVNNTFQYRTRDAFGH